jgi:uncharacterized membrane protein YtjA (UPF0391 family)
MYPLVFLMVGVIAGAVNLEGIAAFTVQISWILIGMVSVVIHAVAGQDVRQAHGGTH